MGKFVPTIRKEKVARHPPKIASLQRHHHLKTSTTTRLNPIDFESALRSNFDSNVDTVVVFYSHESERAVLDIVLERLRDPIYTMRVELSEFGHYNVSFAPCVKKYHRGSEKVSTYRGKLEFQPLKRWLKYYRNGPIAKINSKKTLEMFSSDVGGVFVLGKKLFFSFFSHTTQTNIHSHTIGTYKAGQGLEYLAFLNAAEFDEIPFATCQSRDILSSTLGITDFPSVVLVRDSGIFKRNQEKSLQIITFQGQLQSTKQIDTFVLHNQLPRVLRWSRQIHDKIFTSPYNRRVIMFADDSFEGLDAAIGVFERVSDILTSVLHGSSMSPIFVHVPSNVLDMGSHFGISRDRLPALAFVTKRTLSTDVRG